MCADEESTHMGIDFEMKGVSGNLRELKGAVKARKRK